MEHDVAVAVAVIIGVGIAAQWVGERLRVPSILLLLAAGFVVGPGIHLVEPTEQFTPLLFPLVSLGVGFLLFEGGLELNLRRLETGRSTVLRLVTLGALVTWLVGYLAADLLFDISRGQALLLGAILVVSGPTVVLPLVKHVRPRERVGAVLRWECILIDPIGAALAVAVLEGVIGAQTSAADAAIGIAVTASVGTAVGIAAAAALLLCVHRHWIADHLQIPVAVAVVVVAFTCANQLASEAGLFATTALGVTLANQRRVAVGHIAGFGGQLGPLILAGLFVTLGAMVDPNDLDDVLLPSLGLLVVLLVVARPLAVYLGTVGSDLRQSERMFLATVAPRGIVAAAVSSLVAIELSDRGSPFPELVPITFVVIIGSVVVTGLGARQAARRLRVDELEPRGLALVGSQAWMLDLAQQLVDADVPVLVVDADEGDDHSSAATDRGFLVFQGRLDSEELGDVLTTVGVAQALLACRTPQLNAFAVQRFTKFLGRANVFHLPIDDQALESSPDASTKDAVGRPAFRKDLTQQDMVDLYQLAGDRMTIRPNAEPSADALPLVVIDQTGRARIAPGGGAPPPGERAVVLPLQ